MSRAPPDLAVTIRGQASLALKDQGWQEPFEREPGVRGELGLVSVTHSWVGILASPDQVCHRRQPLFHVIPGPEPSSLPLLSCSLAGTKNSGVGPLPPQLLGRGGVCVSAGGETFL